MPYLKDNFMFFSLIVGANFFNILINSNFRFLDGKTDVNFAIF